MLPVIMTMRRIVKVFYKTVSLQRAEFCPTLPGGLQQVLRPVGEDVEDGAVFNNIYAHAECLHVGLESGGGSSGWKTPFVVVAQML